MKEKILPAAYIIVKIPRKAWIKLFYERRPLSLKQIRQLNFKKRLIEKNILILQHSLSIAEKILLRS